MKTLNGMLILLALTLSLGCSSKNNSEDGKLKNISIEYYEDIPLEEAENDNFAKSVAENRDNQATEGKKIIKDGYISVKTNEIYGSKKNIDAQLKKWNAYYDKEDFQNKDQKISYDLTIRIPSEYFEKFISSLENGKDEITNKSIQARDVTEEYMDIESRLTNKREYLKRYKELLSKAATVKDILAIEENIRVLQEEIESKEGRLKYLTDQVSFSTLNLYLFNEKPFVYKAQEQDKFSERFKSSISNGWKSAVDLVLWTIKIWPNILLIVITFFIIRRIVRKRRRIKTH